MGCFPVTISTYNAIREAVKDLGFVWISSITDKRLRYVVKYVGKSVYMDERSAVFAQSLPITVGKLKTNLYDFLQNSRYRRKFISPGVGHRKSTRLNSSHSAKSRMPSSA